MAQFKRNLFGTSYFGKSYAFIGEYYTRVISTENPFNGHVDVGIKVQLPIITYKPNESNIYTLNEGWKITPAGEISSSSTTELPIFLCADKVELVFSSASQGNVNIRITDDFDKVIYNETINTSTTKNHKMTFSYENLWIYLKPVTTTDKIVLNSVKARVSNIRAELVTASTYESQDVNDLTNYTAIDFTLPLETNQDGWLYGITKVEQVQQSAVALRIFLLSSDTEQYASPVIDTIRLTSGNLDYYTMNGSWQVAMNMNNVASQIDKTFKRTKKVHFIYSEPKEEIANNINWMEEYLPLRSASKDLTAVGDATIPTDLELSGNYYWSPETATYRLYRGQTKPRLSLGHKNNNGFNENKEYGTALFGPINKETMPYINTTLLNWSRLTAAFSSPSETTGTYFKIQVWNTNQIDKYYPVYEQNVTAESSASIPIELTELYDDIYIGIVFYSTQSTQSSVVDMLDLGYQLRYDKIINYTDEVSGLDNMYSSKTLPEAPNGTKLLQTIQANTLGLPTDSINKTYKILFTPHFSNQQILYFGDDKGLPLADQNLADVPQFKIYSRVTPEEPKASVKEVSSDKLYWHYQYDGGNISFPHTVRKEMTTEFTPSLISSNIGTQPRQYCMAVINGWPEQYFTLPQNMTWEEIADITDSSVEALKERNPNILLYENKVQRYTVINLENKSGNPNVTMTFESNNLLNTKKSMWNNFMENDYVIIRAINDTEDIVPWVSEERIFAGVINPNNERNNYVRTQNLGIAGETSSRNVINTSTQAKTYRQLSNEYEVALADLLLANNLLHEYEQVDELIVEPGESIIIPAPPSLPSIPNNVFYEGNNPYVVEIIPGSLRKTYDNIPISDAYLLAGSDDEPPIQYTTVESETKEVIITRGKFSHGQDVLPYPNVNKIVSIKNNTLGTTYTPYSEAGGVKSGDFIFKNGLIDWSPSQTGSKEPKSGQQYTVRFTHNIINTMKLVYTSNYFEKLSFNKLWRSSEIKTITGVVTPEEDTYLDLPELSSYSDYAPYITQVDYVIEDSDLWVRSSLEDTEFGPKIKLSFEGKDPKRNWFPTINKGFYYINDQEYYLYSEPIKHYFGEEQLPHIQDVVYDSKGLLMSEDYLSHREYITNPYFNSGTTTGWSYQPDRITIHQSFEEGYYLTLISDDLDEKEVSFSQTVIDIPDTIVLSLRLRGDSPITVRIGNYEKIIHLEDNIWKTYELLINHEFDTSTVFNLLTSNKVDISSINIKD